MVSPHPRAMGSCCALVRLVEGSMRHKALVRAILQVTGYRKLYVKKVGLIPPRVDGEFTPAFKHLVEHFLEKLRCGTIFFPEIVPDYEGWDTSWLNGERYKWVQGRPREDPTEEGGEPIPSDKERIREAVMLMFENLRDHENTLELDDAITLESCLKGKSCEICAGKETTDDKIAVCENCHVGRHQTCYNLSAMPTKPYQCRACTTTGESKKRTGDLDVTPKSSKKLATSPVIDEARFGPIVGTPFQTRSTRRNFTGGYQSLSEFKPEGTPSPSSKRRVSDGNSLRRTSRSTPRHGTLLPAFGSSTQDFESFSLAGFARPSKDNVPASKAISSNPATMVQSLKGRVPAPVDDMRPAPPQAPFPTLTVSDIQSDRSSTPWDSRTGSPSFVSPAGPEPFEFSAPGTSTETENEPAVDMPISPEKTGISVMGVSTNMNKETEILYEVQSAKQSPANVTTASGNVQILSKEQINHTKLQIRLGAKSAVYRFVELNSIGTLDGIFAACVDRWEDRLKGQTPRIAAYLPIGLDGVTEFTAKSEVSEFLKLIKNEWDRNTGDELTVVMVLLWEDEEF
ncbi:hypothetical protein BKA65DRAFT_584601 [Rhexocercosporidium sp. MPI-PUGE-AT-0058]|nr:hypothetical protein BKA65DRAFT_584601 [Rhexocercosporidium sp. MPI-PUGE-AT-0058]